MAEALSAKGWRGCAGIREMLLFLFLHIPHEAFLVLFYFGLLLLACKSCVDSRLAAGEEGEARRVKSMNETLFA